MKKIMKKALSCILAVLISFSVFAVASSAVQAGDLVFTVNSDGYATLSDCNEDALGIVTIPSRATINGKSYKVKYIGDKAFDNCYGITHISIPEGVTVIGNYAFRNCVSLEEIYIPESLVVCQYDAFTGCGDVLVHCYVSNYQFFTVFGVSSNLTVDIIDAVDEEPSIEDTEVSSSIINHIINAIKNFIVNLLRAFNVLGENEDIELPVI